MNLNNIKVGFNTARNFGKAQRLGAQYADDAFRNLDAARALKNEVTGGLNGSATNAIGSAADTANFYNQRAQYMNDFMKAYAGEAPVYASKAEQVGRAIAGVTDTVGNLGGAVLNNPMGQMALFSAPMLVPMVSGGAGEQQQQLTPQEMQYLQQQQAMQRGGYG
jgi:hypothetical protein